MWLGSQVFFYAYLEICPTLSFQRPSREPAHEAAGAYYIRDTKSAMLVQIYQYGSMLPLSTNVASELQPQKFENSKTPINIRIPRDQAPRISGR